MSGVKFYSTSDLSRGYQLEQLKEIVDNFDQGKINYNINEILELYNITLFIKANLFLLCWDKEEIAKLQETEPLLTKTIAVFMKSITNTSLSMIYNELEVDYIDDFWSLFCKFKLYQLIDAQAVKMILQKNQTHFRFFLSNKMLVDYYDQITKELILADERNAELLLDKFAVQGAVKKVFLNFPACFSENEREELIGHYIQSAEANLNYLRIIIDTLSNSGLVLSNKTRLAARKRVESETKKFFEKTEGMKYGASVCFDEDCDPEPSIRYNKGIIESTYNTKWIESNLDFSTLLNNFIYLFGFVDNQMRITLVSKQTQLGLFERYLTMRPKYAYSTGISFNQIGALSDLQIIGYYRLLKKNNIRIETIIEWFFLVYLNDEFQIKDFHVRMPSENSTFLEKCRIILPEIESILKQYKMYTDENAIDHELLQMSSDHLFFKDIKSVIPTKYIYPRGDEFNEITFCFFSDQSGLSYIDKTKSKYRTLFDLLKNEEVQLDDFQRYQQISLKKLLDKAYLAFDRKGKIQFSNPKVIYLLKELYNNEVLSYWRFPNDFRTIIDELMEKGLVEAKSTLLSKSEEAYFNYHLNKSEFSNSLDLRNKYSHGTQPSDETSEKIHERNYFIFLKLLILLIIKINDDLDIIDEINQNQITS
ncbi:MAG: hypothetical protein CVV04_11410 [Firmicutes bacterium HGW-Firmicutes-9]|jgi:hypothetical protein|nr:MAG: hypothetical protein CVV04_11410 [Firmicutes bacterium HGW-Firmicutes-9]